jgi:hypothetical protein
MLFKYQERTMKNILRLIFVIFALLLLTTGCSTAESALTGVFERINAADPLPDNYGETFKDSAPQPTRQNQNSRANVKRNSGRETTFEEWHNNQY